MFDSYSHMFLQVFPEKRAVFFCFFSGWLGSWSAQEIVDWLQKAQEVTQRCVVLDDLDLGLGSCFVQVNGKASDPKFQMG